MRKRVFQYWHEIIAVSVEYQKMHPEYEKGLVVSESRVKDFESVEMCNVKTGKTYPAAYTLKYICRLRSNLSTKEACKALKEKMGAKEYKEREGPRGA